MSENNEPLLSSEELSAIEKMVEGGEFDQEAYNLNLDAQPYCVSRNEENLGASYGALTQINERFHRFFRTRMLTELDYNPRLSVASPQLMKYSEYIRDVASPSSINVLELAPLRGRLSLLFILKLYLAVWITGMAGKPGLFR